MHSHSDKPDNVLEHQDPVCGMMVEESPDAITYEYNGKKYYFCAPGCKRAFEKDPEKFLREGPQGHM
jgi:YHS domain-containing protein